MQGYIKRETLEFKRQRRDKVRGEVGRRGERKEKKIIQLKWGERKDWSKDLNSAENMHSFCWCPWNNYKHKLCETMAMDIEKHKIIH